ncbi:hypothetical protein Adt_27171 [Abeliophyllum distichum]|uniref:Uncharacterized protein n=1 Tax=Abeliophyllum distichum TaxID=126358 RepID=A0ABD1RUZ6_9LAMI
MAYTNNDSKGKTGENEVEKQIEFPEESDSNPKRQRNEIQEIAINEGGEAPKKKRNRRHKKMSIAQTISNLAEQVQMLVQENKATITLSGARNIADEKIVVENKTPIVSYSHPYSDHRDSQRHQPVDSLNERERRPTRSASVFDRLGDEADSHQRRTLFLDNLGVGSQPKDPIYEPDYS